MERGKVIVRGRDLMRPPLLDSSEPQIIELYDEEHNLIAFLARIFTDNTWGLCTKADPDWPEMCVRYGFNTLKRNTPVKDIINEGVRPFLART